MAGANISGDLRRPDVSIPLGTMAAILVSGVVYFVMIFMIGGTCLREVDGPNITEITDGLLYNYNILIESSASPELIVAGIFAAGLSSALAALVGAPRVFQAVCKDNLFPVLMPFAKGVGANNEPIRAYLLTFCIAIGFICIGDLNGIAPFITNFFLISYALINFACFSCTHSRSPSWRPSFTHFNKWTSLAGCFICLVLMVLIDYATALATFFVFACLFIYVRVNPPDNANWGSALQAQIYADIFVRTAHLERQTPHIKTFRPSFLVLIDRSVEQEEPLVDLFCSVSYIARGVFCVGKVLVGSLEEQGAALREEQSSEFFTVRGKKGFLQPVVAPALVDGYRTLLQATGLGRLRPNIVALRFPEQWAGEEAQRAQALQCVDLLRDALRLGFSLVLLRHPSSARHAEAEAEQEKTGPKKEKRNPDQMLSAGLRVRSSSVSDRVPPEPSVSRRLPAEELPSFTPVCAQKGRIDVYWLSDDGGLTMLLPDLLTRHPEWAGSQLRVITDGGVDSSLAHKLLAKLLEKVRIKATVETLDITEPTNPATWAELKLPQDSYDAKSKYYLKVGELVQKMSADAQLVVATLPIPVLSLDSSVYLARLHVMSSIAKTVPVMFVRGIEPVITFYS